MITTIPAGLIQGVSLSASTSLISSVKETANLVASPATGTINYDVSSQSILYYTSNATANWTMNFRSSSTASLDSIMSTNQSITVVFAATNGTTAYYNNAFQVDGSAVVPKWQGGAAPTAGSVSSVDVYSYQIIKTGTATFAMFASQTQFA